MSWPTNPTNGQQTTIGGIVYQYVLATQTWDRMYATVTIPSYTTAVTVSQQSQPNITSVGTMANLTSTGNIIGANLMGSHANGTSNVNIPLVNGNINLSVNSVPNVLVVTSTGINVAGTLNTGTGNANVGNLGITTDLLVGGNIYVNGTSTAINSTTTRVVDPIIELGGGANGAALTVNDGKDRGHLLHYYTTGVVDAFMGWDNSASEFILASNVTVATETISVNSYGNVHVGNANLGNLATSNYFAGVLTTQIQPNITSTGTLNSITAVGTVNLLGASNVTLGPIANVHISGGTSGQYLQTDGAGGLSWSTINSTALTNGTSNVIVTSSGGNVAIGIGGTSNVVVVSSTALTVTGIVSASGNISSINANLGNLVTANYYTGTLTTNAQPNITSVGTLNGVTMAAGTSLSGGNILSANYVTGTLTAASASQPNITSVGTLANLVVNGNLTVSGAFEYANVTTFRVQDPIVEMGGKTDGTALTTNDGYDRGILLHYYSGTPVDAFMGWDNSASEFVVASNASVATEVATFNQYGNLRANWHVGTGVSVTGNVSASNANLGNLVTSNYFHGVFDNTSSSQPNITAVGTLANLSVTNFVNAASHTTTGAVIGNANVSTVTGNFGLRTISSTYTDNVVAISTTVSNAAVHAIATPTLAASNTGVVFTNAASFYIQGAPTAGTNATLTNPYALMVGGGNSIFNGGLIVNAWATFSQTTEVLNNLGAVAAATVTCNVATGASFYHSSVTSGANWTVNFTNVPTTDGRSIIVTLMVAQGVTSYIPSAVQIDGVAQTIKWNNGTTPTGTPNAVDIFSFGLIRTSGAWAQVLGSYSTYT